MVPGKKEFSAIITSAGNSTRMGNTKKEYLQLPNAEANITVISENIFKFLKTDLFNIIILTVPKKDLQIIDKIIFKDARIKIELAKTETQLLFTAGGETRQASVFNGLAELEKFNKIQEQKNELQTQEAKTQFVLIHDGARPWLSEELIKKVCKQTKEKGSAIPAINAVDTQKLIDRDGKIIEHLKRDSIFSVQTPQGFNFAKLLQAHKIAKSQNLLQTQNLKQAKNLLQTQNSIQTENLPQAENSPVYTDDSEIYALVDKNIFICEGEIKNKKITFKEDLEKR